MATSASPSVKGFPREIKKVVALELDSRTRVLGFAGLWASEETKAGTTST